ncbi:hypothetical protein NDU88_004588 [Pleurodeles waltl]|uniref:Uncharacterized protein n=1 Tax=Pleurodeles waltl TaxID=8319 RepID=A0AAV7SJ80_PLEWA|nr:hypothetical protein NDU88_004588 [Pleurodeles waltl]
MAPGQGCWPWRRNLCVACGAQEGVLRDQCLGATAPSPQRIRGKSSTAHAASKVPTRKSRAKNQVVVGEEGPGLLSCRRHDAAWICHAGAWWGIQQRFPVAADGKDPCRGSGRAWHRGGIGRGHRASCRRCQEGAEELRRPPAAELCLLQGVARCVPVGGTGQASLESSRRERCRHTRRGKAPSDHSTGPEWLRTQGHRRYPGQVGPPSSPVVGSHA